jgi:hypothetical protein
LRVYNYGAGCFAALSEDRRTLVIKRRLPGGVQTSTLRRRDDAGPFTEPDVIRAVSLSAAMQPGQRNMTRRSVTRFGTVWTHLMLGPPTWRAPRVRRDGDGTLMAGWLRAAVAVKVEPGPDVPGQGLAIGGCAAAAGVVALAWLRHRRA